LKKIIIVIIVTLAILLSTLIAYAVVRVVFPRRLPTFCTDEYVAAYLLRTTGVELNSKHTAQLVDLVNSSEITRYHSDTNIGQSPNEIITFIHEDGSEVHLWIHSHVINLGGHGGHRFQIVNHRYFWEELDRIYYEILEAERQERSDYEY